MKTRIVIAGAACIMLVLVLDRAMVKPVLAQVRAALVQDVDEPGRNALALSGQNTHSPTYTYTFNVPSTQRYVVDSYSVSCTEGGALTDITLSGSTGGVPAMLSTTTHAVRPADIYVDGRGATIYQGTGSGRLVADPGSALTIRVSDGSRFGGDGPCVFYVSGYTIASP